MITIRHGRQRCCLQTTRKKIGLQKSQEPQPGPSRPRREKRSHDQVESKGSEEQLVRSSGSGRPAEHHVPSCSHKHSALSSECPQPSTSRASTESGWRAQLPNRARAQPSPASSTSFQQRQQLLAASQVERPGRRLDANFWRFFPLDRWQRNRSLLPALPYVPPPKHFGSPVQMPRPSMRAVSQPILPSQTPLHHPTTSAARPHSFLESDSANQSRGILFLQTHPPLRRPARSGEIPSDERPESNANLLEEPKETEYEIFLALRQNFRSKRRDLARDFEQSRRNFELRRREEHRLFTHRLKERHEIELGNQRLRYMEWIRGEQGNYSGEQHRLRAFDRKFDSVLEESRKALLEAHAVRLASVAKEQEEELSELFARHQSEIDEFNKKLEGEEIEENERLVVEHQRLCADLRARRARWESQQQSLRGCAQQPQQQASQQAQSQPGRQQQQTSQEQQQQPAQQGHKPTGTRPDPK